MNESRKILNQLKSGYLKTGLLLAACKLKLPQLVPKENGISIEEIVKTLKIPDAHRFFRFVKSLVASQIFKLEIKEPFEKSIISHNEVSSLLLEDISSILYLDTHYKAFSKVKESLLDPKGRSGFYHFSGETIWEYFQKNDEQRRHFDSAMTNMSLQFVQTVQKDQDILKFFENKVVVDVGGGKGHVLLGLLEVCKESKGIVFDVKSVVEHGKEYVQKEYKNEDVKQRISFVDGDFFKERSIPEGDVYFLRHIIHDWDDEKSIKILRNIKSAMKKPNTKVILFEFLMDEEKIVENDPIYNVDSVMNFVADNGRERTKTEFMKLFKEAGLEFEGIYNVKGSREYAVVGC